MGDRTLDGWVLDRRGEAPQRPVPLRVCDAGGAELAAALTLPDGRFAVPLPEDTEAATLVVEVPVGTEREPYRQRVGEERPLVLTLDLGPGQSPEAGPTPALLTPVAAEIASAIARHEAAGALPDGSSSVVAGVLGRLAWLEDLLGPSQDAILGEPGAASVIREAVGSWAAELEPTPLPADRDDEERPGEDAAPVDAARADVVSPAALGLLVSAVLAAGRSVEEQVELADGLGAILSAHRWLAVMAGATRTDDVPVMRTMMGAPLEVPGLPGGGLPGTPHGPGDVFPGLPGGLPGGRPKGVPGLRVHPTVADLVARFRSPQLWPPSDRERCLVGAIVEVARIQRDAPKYRITRIDPPDACPGTRLTITGRNFGGQGTVVFPGAAPPVPSLNAILWSDTRIVVVVPPGAAPGELRLSILEAAFIRCQQLFTAFRAGSSDVRFEGGTAAVLSFRLNGSETPLRVDPGELVSISCEVTPHPLARTRVWVTQGAATLADFGVVAGGGFRQHVLTAPSPTAATTCTVHLQVSGPCGAVDHTRDLLVSARPRMRVAHIEVTQGLQDAAHTVRLVSGRTTGVRAYLTSGLGAFTYTGTPGELPNVTGTLTVERSGSVVATLPAAAAVTIGDSFTDADRSTTTRALNFVVPGHLVSGQVTMRVTARAIGLPGFDTSPGASGSRTVPTVRPGAVTVMRLRMGLTNAAHASAVPSVADWQGSAVGAQDRYPIHDGGLVVRVPTAGDALSSGRFLGNDDGWDDALDDLDDYADRFDDFGIVFACVVPANPTFSLNGIAHASNDRPWPLENDRRCLLAQSGLRATFAHEMAHTLDVGHAPCGGPEGVDGRLPAATEPGVVGWRTSDGLLMSPMWSELMSYCTPPSGAYDDRWPSVALWNILLDLTS